MRSIIKHPGIRSFLVYMVANQLNDPLAISLGGLPITLTDFAIIYGILINRKYTNYFVFKKVSTFFLFTIILFIYSIYALLLRGQFLLYPLSLLFNLLWVYYTASSFITKPLQDNATLKLFKIIFWLLVPNLIFGFYELITKKYFFQSGLSGAMSSGISQDVFYIRGSFTDKFDFSSYMILGPLMYLVLFVNNIRVKWIYRLIAFLSLILILFSFSSTVILTLAAILFYAIIFQASNKKKITLLFLLGAIVIVLIVVFFKSSLVSIQQTSYELKYQQEVEGAEDNNFRILAFKTGIIKFFDSPIWGYGMDNGKNIIYKYSKIRLSKPINSHNYFINNLLDYGLIGSITITIAILRLFNLFKRVKKSGPPIKVLSDLITLLFLFHLITMQTYYHQFDLSMYFVFIVLLFFYISQKLTYESIDMRT